MSQSESLKPSLLDPRLLGEAIINASNMPDGTIAIDGKRLVFAPDADSVFIDLSKLSAALARPSTADRGGEVEAGFRERCKAFYQAQGRRAMLREGSPVEDIMAFVLDEFERGIDETGWLAELQGEAVPQWAVLTEDYDEHWTTDVGKALRFSRREDAEAFIAHHAWTRVVATEHMWPAARTSSALATTAGEANLRRVIEESIKQLDTIIDDGAPTDFVAWRDDLRAALVTDKG